MPPRLQVKYADTLQLNTSATTGPHPTTTAFLHGLPNEIIFYVMDSLLPRDVVMLSQVSIRIRPLAIAYLASEWDIIVIDHPQQASAETSPGDPLHHGSNGYKCMSGFELFARMLLAEMCTGEIACPAFTDGKEVAQIAMGYCKRILRRLYLLDPMNEHWTNDSMRTSGTDNDTTMITSNCATVASDPRQTSLNPYITSPWNLHVIARVMADLVCRGHCLPETAVLVLQLLTSLLDQDQFQYLLNAPDRNLTVQMPRIEDRVSVGQLCFQYLVPNIMALLKPPVPIASMSTTEPAVNCYTGLDSSYLEGDQLRRDAAACIQPHVLPCRLSAHGHSTATDHPRNLTSNVLASQQSLLLPIRVRSVTHLTRMLCFLPLLGRHVNVLPTSTFIETFLDRSKGDLPIDRAAVMVYGFMCVLDLDSGKANLAADSYKIFERSMPTQGVVQAEEMVRVVERHRLLMRGLLLSSPTFSSTRLWQ